jgi:hypothetical protein
MSQRGGARQGSGRKPVTKKYSDALKKDIYNALQKKTKEAQKSFGDLLVELVFDKEEKNGNLRLGAIRAIQEILLIKETQSTSDVNVAKYEGPAIMLPAVKPVPIRRQEEKEGAPLH